MTDFFVKGCDDCPFLGNDIDICNAITCADDTVVAWLESQRTPPPEKCPLRVGAVTVSLIGAGGERGKD